ncbi:hypothetical protein F5X99DRAFT_385381 [Biscogniauxia marginata]|nr:hypothetical protein F5X99DRAFT_385381 [Biscogniauxia marginata]
MSAYTSTPVTASQSVEQRIEARQVTLTQTITNADSTITAIVTLDRGDPPSSTPSNAPSTPPLESATSDGVTQQQFGIIIGTCLGAVALVLLIWLCCVVRRRRRAYINYLNDLDQISEENITVTETVQPPRTSYYPPFPHSIPPPVVPVYRARAPTQAWTARDSARYIYGRNY